MLARYRLPLLSFVLLLMAAQPARSERTIFVDADAPDGGQGTSWANAFNTLSDALVAAQSGDQLWIAEGEYRPDQGQHDTVGNREETFYISDDISLYGGFAGWESTLQQRDIDANPTILSGDLAQDDLPNYRYRTDNSYHVVIVTASTEPALLDGITISSGYINTEDIDWYHGAAILAVQSCATLRNCTISDNFALAGGGITGYYSDFEIIDCRFVDNFSTGGT